MTIPKKYVYPHYRENQMAIIATISAVGTFFLFLGFSIFMVIQTFKK
jgi:hypothetical protein